MLLKTVIALVFFTIAYSLNVEHSSFLSNRRIPLEINGYADYTINVTIGTPPQPFRLMFTTEESDFYVVSTECKEDEMDGTLTKQKYNQSSSTSTKPTNEKFDNGLLSGIKVSDNFKIGDITLGQQQFGSAKFSQYHSDEFDGKIGFGFHGYSTRPVRPIVDQLKSYLSKPQFTVAIKNTTTSKGFVTFGEYDNVNCAGVINYAPIVSRSFQWQVKFSGYAIGDNKVNREQQVRPTFSFDAYSIPKTALTSLVKQTKAIFDKTLGYVFNCDTISTFPSIELYLNGVKYSLEGKDYTEERYDRNRNKYCRLNVRASHLDDWSLRNTFFQKYCVTFDVGNERLGFSKIVQ